MYFVSLTKVSHLWHCVRDGLPLTQLATFATWLATVVAHVLDMFLWCLWRYWLQAPSKFCESLSISWIFWLYNHLKANNLFFYNTFPFHLTFPYYVGYSSFCDLSWLCGRCQWLSPGQLSRKIFLFSLLYYNIRSNCVLGFHYLGDIIITTNAKKITWMISHVLSTTVPGTVPMLHQLSRAPDSITLSWPQPDRPNGDILEYQLRYYDKAWLQKNHITYLSHLLLH